MTTPDSSRPVGGAESAAHRAAELNLAEALRGLSELVISNLTLKQLLTSVADFALRAVPGADGVGVTMLESGQPDTIVASDTFVKDVDAIQYRLGEGPCISAAAEGRTVSSGSLADDPSWPRFGPLVSALNVFSALSLPLIVDGEVFGALNVYAHRADAFGPTARQLGERYAIPAAVTVHNARRLEEAMTLTTQLRAERVTRQVIDQAIGLLMARLGVSPEDAFARLRMSSQREGRPVAAVAAALVQATRPTVMGGPER